MQVQRGYDGGGHGGQLVGGFVDDGVCSGVSLLQGRIQQSSQRGNFFLGRCGRVGEPDDRLHAFCPQAVSHKGSQSSGGGATICGTHHSAQDIPPQRVGASLVIDQVSPATAASLVAIGGAGVADGTRAGDEHRTNRCSQRPGQCRNLIANDLQRTAVATCTDGVLKKW